MKILKLLTNNIAKSSFILKGLEAASTWLFFIKSSLRSKCCKAELIFQYEQLNFILHKTLTIVYLIECQVSGVHVCWNVSIRITSVRKI